MARSFTAASSQALVHAAAALTAAPMTMACWFNGAGSGSRTLMSLDDNTADFFLLRLLTDGNISCLTGDSGSNANSDTTGGSSNGAWNHAAGVWAAANSRTAYLNGAAASASTTSVTPSAITQTQIGRLWAATQHMDGLIAEAAIWSVALDAAEIAGLAKGVCPLLIRPTSLVGYWPLFGNESPEPDRWKNRFDLTLVNAPTKADHPRIYYPAGPAAMPMRATVQANTSQMFAMF